ncbi:hypothetical protein CTAYLR_006115 [Chrysophaeum taylorii]|uniref:Chlorophyll a-b binding protein, chloroplastic n=1 Tax=Chrysophaeum taylorii TaxID=2483200 RepID=A0AAD7UB77_9STRA|nr:hypothetical protein CTAYLR_006115 [Chrysophaeum taylorii]
MMAVVVALALAPLAAGFQAAQVKESLVRREAFGGLGTAKKSGFDPSTALGAQPPTGFWDPLGLADGISEEQFNRFRTVEQKHGRIAMLAVLGYVVPQYVGTFGDVYLSTSEKVKFSDIPLGVQAIFKIPTLGVLQILLLIGILETQFPNVNGDYGTGYFGQFLEEPVKSKKLAIELSNGRLAMLAILGLFFQDVVSGGKPFDGPQFSPETFTSL